MIQSKKKTGPAGPPYCMKPVETLHKGSRLHVGSLLALITAGQQTAQGSRNVAEMLHKGNRLYTGRLWSAICIKIIFLRNIVHEKVLFLEPRMFTKHQCYKKQFWLIDWPFLPDCLAIDPEYNSLQDQVAIDINVLCCILNIVTHCKRDVPL